MDICSCGNTKEERYIMCISCYDKKVKLENITSWLNQLKSCWLKKDINAIVKLFTEDCECWDTPFFKSHDVREDWQEIKSQNIKDISYKILLNKDYEFFVEFLIQYDNELCSAINYIKLNKDLKCFYLKQWFMSDMID